MTRLASGLAGTLCWTGLGVGFAVPCADGDVGGVREVVGPEIVGPDVVGPEIVGPVEPALDELAEGLGEGPPEPLPRALAEDDPVEAVVWEWAPPDVSLVCEVGDPSDPVQPPRAPVNTRAAKAAAGADRTTLRTRLRWVTQEIMARARH